MIGLFKIFDAHVHFYSNSFFRFLVKQKPNRADISSELKNIAMKGHIEIPGEDPVQLAKRWADAIDKWKIERLILIGSMPGDEDSVVQAVQAYPKRFTGFFTVDPNSNMLMENTEKRLKQDKLRGIFLYPSLYQIGVNDEWLYPLYNLVQESKGIVFVHFGKLLIRPRDFAGVPTVINDAFADPRDLIPVAKKFPQVRWVIPNFGAGKFTETLEVGKQCPNVYVDTAGSNSWMEHHPEKPDLRKVYQKALEVFGAGRILFGSDSGMMPRGYRYDILDNQLKLVQEMRIPTPEIKKIFYENLAGLIDSPS
ncbi:MAG: amidohydrolase family protein [Ignavibacteriales bacterium]|nr:amidohydrolase family protein [Ignavibacteriales bacterium]